MIMKKQYIKPAIDELAVEPLPFLAGSNIPLPPAEEGGEEDADGAAAKPLNPGYGIWDDSEY